jgi:hypothetical protein
VAVRILFRKNTAEGRLLLFFFHGYSFGEKRKADKIQREQR